MTGIVAEMKEINFFGLKLSIFSKEFLFEIYQNAIANKEAYILFGWSLTTIPKIKQYPQLVTLVNSFEFNIPDGRGLYNILKLMGYSLPNHFSIPDMVDHILCLANGLKFPVYLLGGTEKINDLAKLNIASKYHLIPSVEGRNGYLDGNEVDAVINGIAKASPGVVLLGMSTPMKEELAVRLRSQLSSCLIVPCGGVIDIYGGKTSREPRILQKFALAWLYRVCLEPKRLFGPVFINGVRCVILDLPICFFRKYVLKNTSYTFESYYS